MATSEQSRGLHAVCIRCGHQGRAATRCARCDGAVIQTTQGQAVRESSSELARSLHLPGIDDRRLARGTQPPDVLVRAAARTTAALAADAPAPEPPAIRDAPEPGRTWRALLVVVAILMAAGLFGVMTAVLEARF